MSNSIWGYQSSDMMQLAYLTRGGMVESRHFGLGALVGPDGKLIAELGNSRKLIYPRSAVKPLQAVAMRRSGLMLEGAELALSSASHQGTEEHIALVKVILESHGLSEKDLMCPVAWPGNPSARARSTEQSRLAFNCSGKHAAFLAACVVNSWDTKTYLDPKHPLQTIISEVIEEFAGEKIAHSSIDGCGAPLHALSVKGLARSIGKFALEETQIRDAMIASAWVVGDHGAMDSVILEAGMVAKIGAEGVFVIGLKSGEGVAIKVADGSLRAAGPAALKLLANSGLISAEELGALLSQMETLSLGGSELLGKLELAF